MRRILGFVMTAALVLGVGSAGAQTTLVAGDIAIVGYNSDTTGGDTKGFAFVTLRDLAAGTEIMFTDSGFNTSTGLFGSTEGCLVYTAPSAIAKGTVVKYVGTGATSGDFVRADARGFGANGLNLSTSGDQIAVLQGTGSTSWTAIFAINMDGAWADQSSSNNGNVPTGLTNGTNAIVIAPEIDNAAFTATRNAFADKTAALAAIMNPANWSTSDTAGFTFDMTSFTPLPVSVSAFGIE